MLLCVVRVCLEGDIDFFCRFLLDVVVRFLGRVMGFKRKEGIH